MFLQEAARRKLSVTADEVDAGVSGLRRRFADLESFGTWMRERDLDDATLFDTVRDDLLVRRVRVVLQNEMKHTDGELRAYFDLHRRDLTGTEEVRLHIIALESLEAVAAVLEALSDGEDFARLARKLSRGERATQGGDTGWIATATLPPALGRVVRGLERGEAAGPIEKDAGELLIVALADRRFTPATTFDEARLEIEQRLRDSKLEEWLDAQEEASEIETVHTR